MNRQRATPGPFSRRAAPYPPPPEPEGLELTELFRALRRRKWMILGCILVSGLIAMAVLKNARPQYFSTVEVLLNTREERVVGVEQVISALDVSNSIVAGEIAVVQSNLLLGQVVDELDLMHHPEFAPEAIASPGMLSRMGDRVAAVLSAIGLRAAAPEPMPDTPESGRMSEEDARNLVIWKVRRNLTVFQSGISYVITISMRAEDPKAAADIANAIADKYIGDQLEAKLVATRRVVDWLDRRLIELETQLRNAEDAVVDFMAKQVREEGGDEQGVSQQLTQMNNAVVVARSDRAAAASRLAYIREVLDTKGAEDAAAILSTTRLTNLDTELAELERQRAQLASRLGPQHPDMRAVQMALQDVLRDRAAAIRAAVDELAAAEAEAKGREAAILADIATAQQLQVELLRSRVRLSQLERSAGAMRQVYESFLARFQETAQQLEFQRADARVISAAQPSLSPARPRKKLVMAVALVLGAMLGIAAALISAAMDRRIRSAAELARITRLPVLATLPRLRLRGPAGSWQTRHLRGAAASSYAEGLRLLRFSLMKNAGVEPPRIVLLTGADWGAGTSTTVVGLARVMADVGLNVVVLDANLRRPGLAGLLGTGTGTGNACIESYLAGTATVSDITRAQVEPGLSVIHAPRNPAMAADLISSPAFEALVRDLAQRHDVVLIDAPPATGMADTAALAGLADLVVLVVRSRSVDEARVVDAINTLEGAGGDVLGTVLSHAEERVRVQAPRRLTLKQPARETAPVTEPATHA